MRLPRYAAYKETAIGWAREFPKHWTVASLKWLCERYSGGTPDKTRPEYWEGGAIPWLNSGAVNDGRIYEASAYITHDAFQNSSAKWIPAGALVMALAGQGKTKGTVAQLMFEATCNQSMAAVVPKHRIDARYLYWWLASNYQNIRNMAGGDLRDGLNLDLLGSIPCPLPPLEEQSAVAAFLDSETNKIDALIAEQEKLIALLAEKRQTIISHAVTRGLNSDAPMKDSGVAWLGEVPAHWKVGKIQSFARRESGHTPSRQRPEFWENCTIPWFSLADVWQIRDGDVEYVHETKEMVSELGIENSSARLLPAGTVMLSRTASVGYSAIMGCDMATTQDFINWVCRPQLMPEFLLHVLRGMRSEFDRLMMGSTHQTIYMPDVAKLMMTLPPLIEQEAIVAFVRSETAKLNALRDDAERAVLLLKERRSALIAAAVTGQIDVRGTIQTEASHLNPDAETCDIA
jgi:type I restriction enzyme, S subunit